jgi:hypothetical protein
MAAAGANARVVGAPLVLRASVPFERLNAPRNTNQTPPFRLLESIYQNADGNGVVRASSDAGAARDAEGY